MKKKTYLKPSMQVVEMRRHQPLLLVSDPESDPTDEGYIPNKREDMNQMA